MTPVLGVVKADIFETKDCILHQSTMVMQQRISFLALTVLKL